MKLSLSAPADGEERLTLETSDGQALTAYLFRANAFRRQKKSVIVAPGTGIKQTYYRSFASYLAEHGYDVITFDFRMIGESTVKPLKKCAATYIHWGRLDFPAVIKACQKSFPEQPIDIIGHSAGAWLIALNPAHGEISGVLAISSMNGYWKKIKSLERYKHLFLWTIAVPPISRLWGYAPGWLGLKADLSTAHARQWANWSLHRDFLFSDPEVQPIHYANAFIGRITAFVIDDDQWTTMDATKDLYQRFTRAKLEFRSITPQDAQGEVIGHFGFFRKKFASSLWPIALQWLQDDDHQRSPIRP